MKRYQADYDGYIYEKPSTYWTSETDIKQHLSRVDFKQDEIKAGGIPIISDGKTAYIDDSDAHTVVEAISGQKKSLCVFMPLIYTLALGGENMVITDPKGELFQRTSGFLANRQYTIHCLDFRKMDKDAFNILEYPAQVYKNVDKEKGLAMLSDIVNMLAEEQRKQAKDRFWPDTAANYLQATGAIMFDCYPVKQIHIKNWAEFNNCESVNQLNELLPMIPDGSTVKTALKDTFSSAENTLRSILITASSFLSAFNQNSKLTRMVCHSTFSLQELSEKKKTALYIISDDTTTTSDRIIGMIINQIQTFLVNQAFLNGGKLKYRSNFILEEFTSLSIPNMDKALAAHRSRGIRYFLCVQSLAGLREKYSYPEALLANCSNTLFLGSTEMEMLEEVSRKCGTSPITADGTEKPLISTAELLTLRKAWDYKEALYLNLNHSVRFVTTMPSIESYNIGKFPVPSFNYKHEINSYTLDNLCEDISKGKVHPPFYEKVSKESKSEPEIDSVQGNDEETLPEEKMTWDDLIALCTAEEEET